MGYTYSKWMHDGTANNGVPFWALRLNGYTGSPILQYFGDGSITTPKGQAVFQSTLNSINNSLTNLENSTLGWQGDYEDIGWVKMPNGFILQWGNAGGGATTLNFPITFPNACYQVLSGNTDAQGKYVDNAFSYPISNSTFFLATEASDPAHTTTSYPTCWLAWGT